MTKKPDPRAFPVPEFAVSAGMSLRDYFAGQALVGIVQRMTKEGHHDERVAYEGAIACEAFRIIACEAFRIADAMMWVRDEVRKLDD